MLRFLLTEGFTLVRIRGSHHFCKRDYQHTTVPIHGNGTLPIGTLRAILRDIDLTPTQFELRWMKRGSRKGRR